MTFATTADASLRVVILVLPLHCLNRHHPKSTKFKIKQRKNQRFTYITVIEIGIMHATLGQCWGFWQAVLVSVEEFILCQVWYCLSGERGKPRRRGGVYLRNSLVGLASKWQLGMVSLSMIMPALMVVGMGGAIGSYLGASRLPTRYVLMALMGVMALASGLLMVKS